MIREGIRIQGCDGRYSYAWKRQNGAVWNRTGVKGSGQKRTSRRYRNGADRILYLPGMR